MSDAMHPHAPTGLDGVRPSNWGWCVALGATLMVLGAVALVNLMTATLVSVVTIAILMMLGGAAQIVHAVGVRTWGGFGLWLGGGALYTLAGVFMYGNPLLASTILTIVLAIFLLVGGVLRIAAGLGARPHRAWGWMVAGGVVTMAAGLVILGGWPVNSLWLIGLFVGVDLIVQGWAWVAFGAGLRPTAP